MSKPKRFKVLVDTRKKGATYFDIEALTVDLAIKSARPHGQVISAKRSYSFAINDPLSRNDRINFLTRLSGLQSARVGASESLALMAQFYKGPIKRVSLAMLNYIESGADIADAMDKIGQPDFPRHITALVKAGSKGGDTGKALEAALEFEIKLYEIKKQSSGGIWSGLAGFACAAGMTIATTEYFGPMVLESDLMKIGGDAIDVAWANTLAEVTGYAMIVISVVFGFLMLLSTLGRLAIPNFADKIILRIPFYKDLVLAKNNFVVLYGLSRLVATGVPMDQALKLQADASPKGSMRTDLEDAFKAVKTGRPWAMAMMNLHPTDKAALSTSQDKVQVSRALEAMSRQYQNIFAQRVSTIGPVLQMTAVLFLCLSGLILFGQTVIPILQLSAGGLG